MASPSKKKRGGSKMQESPLPESVSLDEDKQKSFETKLKKIKQKKNDETLTPGVVYVGNIPHGFFEPQMKQFFSQFGKVTKIRLSRSKKSGRSKGYAFIEFACDEVAKIVGETMNNYLMFERLLKCKFIPADQQHPELFQGSNRKFAKPKAHKLAIARHNTKNQENKQQATSKRFLQKHRKKMAALAEMGVELKINNIETAVKEAKKSLQNKKKKGDNPEQPELKLEKTDEIEISSAIKTPRNKKVKTMEIKSEPAKINKRKLLEKQGQTTGKTPKTVKSLKRPAISSSKKKRLSV